MQKCMICNQEFKVIRWKILRIWESEINSDFDSVLKKIEAFVKEKK